MLALEVSLRLGVTQPSCLLLHLPWLPSGNHACGWFFKKKIIKTIFYKSRFSFIAKSRRRYRELPYTPAPHMHSPSPLLLTPSTSVGHGLQWVNLR